MDYSFEFAIEAKGFYPLLSTGGINKIKKGWIGEDKK